MQPIPDAICSHFTAAFCYGRKGYSLRELERLFAGYELTVPAVGPGSLPTKDSYFRQCLYALTPQNQRLFLYDLCDDPPPATGPLPPPDKRRELLRLLAQADGVSPLALEVSLITLRGIREQWFTAASRLHDSPSSAITAARALLESTCKAIITERGAVPDDSGDLSRLYKQVRQILGIEPKSGTGQGTHQIVNGLTQVVNGLAANSNLSGDRHGLVGGERIDEHSLAGLAVHAAGTVSLFATQVHKVSARASDKPA